MRAWIAEPKSTPARDVQVRSAQVRGALVIGVLGVLYARSALCTAQSSSPTSPREASHTTVEITGAGLAVRAAPSARSARRGTIRQGTRVARFESVNGPGCQSSWIRIGERAFVCGSFVQMSDLPPWGEQLPIVPDGMLLPRSYAFVGVDGTWAYQRPQDYFMDDWTESLGQGFGIIVRDYATVSGVRFAQSTDGLWIAASELRSARGSEFHGVMLEGELNVGWIARDGVRIHSEGGNRIAARRELVRVVADEGRTLRLDSGTVRAREVIRPELSTIPEGLATDERWIDIDTRTQTLVLYRGRVPLFATLVSSGRNHRTPQGAYRIWAKLAEDTMDDLGRTDVERNYAIEGVPWVQYFHEGIALHAAFWHDDFGHPRSHGCINLSPRDARFLFSSTEPSLPDGWDAITTIGAATPGTLVRVR